MKATKVIFHFLLVLHLSSMFINLSLGAWNIYNAHYLGALLFLIVPLNFYASLMCVNAIATIAQLENAHENKR